MKFRLRTVITVLFWPIINGHLVLILAASKRKASVQVFTCSFRKCSRRKHLNMCLIYQKQLFTLTTRANQVVQFCQLHSIRQSNLRHQVSIHFSNCTRLMYTWHHTVCKILRKFTNIRHYSYRDGQHSIKEGPQKMCNILKESVQIPKERVTQKAFIIHLEWEWIQ